MMYAHDKETDHVLVYRWIDDAGHVQYSDSSPIGVDTQMIAVSNAQLPVDTALQSRIAAIDALTKQEIAFDQHERAAKRLDKALDAARRKSCEQVAAELARLESRPGPKLLIVDSNGNVTRMTESERQRKMSLATQKLGECSKAQ